MTQPDAGESPDVLRELTDRVQDAIHDAWSEGNQAGPQAWFMSSDARQVAKSLANEVRTALAGRTQGEPEAWRWIVEDYFTDSEPLPGWHQRGKLWPTKAAAEANLMRNRQGRTVPLYRASPAPATPAGPEPIEEQFCVACGRPTSPPARSAPELPGGGTR